MQIRTIVTRSFTSFSTVTFVFKKPPHELQVVSRPRAPLDDVKRPPGPPNDVKTVLLFLNIAVTFYFMPIRFSKPYTNTWTSHLDHRTRQQNDAIGRMRVRNHCNVFIRCQLLASMSIWLAITLQDAHYSQLAKTYRDIRQV